jgi:hypothetical protein
MRRHRTLDGAPAPYENLEGPSRPLAQAVLRVLAGPRGGRLLRRPVVIATRAAGALRLRPVERRLAYALWFAEARRGYRYEAGVSG